jgi:bifunctional DNA-binding transcriptional regulator/antitoxin component of YhaV-PrlF toxin-antitoxin module
MKKEIEFQTVRVGRRGQVVIPLSFRKEAKIKPRENILAVRIGKKIFYEKIEDFLTDRFVMILQKGLKSTSWKDVEKQRAAIDREIEKEMMK